MESPFGCLSRFMGCGMLVLLTATLLALLALAL